MKVTAPIPRAPYRVEPVYRGTLDCDSRRDSIYNKQGGRSANKCRLAPYADGSLEAKRPIHSWSPVVLGATPGRQHFSQTPTPFSIVGGLRAPGTLGGTVDITI